MTELMARGADGSPVGNKDAPQVIKPPNGVSQNDWVAIIELAVLNFRMTAGIGKPEKSMLKALDIDDSIPAKSWDLVFDYPVGQEAFMTALAVRGVVPLGQGLTAKQSIALELVTDPNQPGNLATKLRKLGVKQAEFQGWLQQSAFLEQYKLLAEKRMNSARFAVDTTLAQKALDGEMDAIKYFDKRVGRDPDKKDEVDGRMVVSVVLDVLTKHLAKQPDLLREIAAELEVRTKLNGNVYH